MCWFFFLVSENKKWELGKPRTLLVGFVVCDAMPGNKIDFLNWVESCATKCNFRFVCFEMNAEWIIAICRFSFLWFWKIVNEWILLVLILAFSLFAVANGHTHTRIRIVRNGNGTGHKIKWIKLSVIKNGSTVAIETRRLCGFSVAVGLTGCFVECRAFRGF